jgi:hypothetical protein
MHLHRKQNSFPRTHLSIRFGNFTLRVRNPDGSQSAALWSLVIISIIIVVVAHSSGCGSPFQNPGVGTKSRLCFAIENESEPSPVHCFTSQTNTSDDNLIAPTAQQDFRTIHKRPPGRNKSVPSCRCTVVQSGEVDDGHTVKCHASSSCKNKSSSSSSSSSGGSSL